MIDDEDLDLIARYRANRDPAAARRILTKFDRWMRIEAQRASRRYGIDFEDAMQASRLGLMDAIETYDPERGATLLTAASWKAWPHQSQARAQALGTTRRKMDERRVLRKAERALGGQPTDAALLDHLGWTQGRLNAARAVNVSLDAPLAEDDDGGTATHHDVIADKASLRPDAIFERKEHQSHLRGALLGAIGTALPDRPSQILMMYFEAGCELGAMGDIAEELGVTRQYVSLAIKDALPRLRRALELNGIRASAVGALGVEEG